MSALEALRDRYAALCRLLRDPALTGADRAYYAALCRLVAADIEREQGVI